MNGSLLWGAFMNSRRIALAAFAAILATAAHAADPIVQFNTGPVQRYELLRDKVIVYGDDGRPRFAATAAFLATASGPGGPRLWAWDQTAKRVRISADGPGMWLACADLAAMPLVCAARVHIGADGGIIVDQPTTRRGRPQATPEMFGLPLCPGDPRCPQL